MPKHKSAPHKTNSFDFRTGKPPISSAAVELSEQVRWMLNWIGQRQFFWYAGPGPIQRDLLVSSSPHIHQNPDYDFTGDPYFAVITKSQLLPNVGHQLGGELIPWRYQSGASIGWTPSGGSQVSMFSATADSHLDMENVTFSDKPSQKIKLYNDMYDPGVSGGGFDFHKLSYSGMMVAGLGIWTAPDRSLSTSWRLFNLAEFLMARQVRGDVSGLKLGLGRLLGEMDEIKYRTGRCLFQSGHPVGVCTSSTAYVNLRHDDSSFMVQPVAMFSGDDVPCTVAIVAGAVGATAGNPGYIKVESSVSGDSYEFEITSDTEALYTKTAFDIYKTKEKFVVSIKAPADGALYVRTLSLWED